MKRDLVIFSDDRLTTVCDPVKAFDSNLHELVDDLFSVMYANDGVGLAAPQIGVLQRVFVMDCREGRKPHNPLCFINPEILVMTGADFDEEGCLSMPGVLLSVRRATYLHFASLTLSGDRHGASLRGLEARIMQHEIDHLSGILFTERALEAAGRRK